MSSEKAITRNIMKHMRHAGWYVRKNHGNMYQPAGIPDLICHRQGETLYIEVKMPNRKPTPLQCKTMDELRTYGISCVVATSPEDVRIFWNEFKGPTEESPDPVCGD